MQRVEYMCELCVINYMYAEDRIDWTAGTQRGTGDFFTAKFGEWKRAFFYLIFFPATMFSRGFLARWNTLLVRNTAPMTLETRQVGTGVDTV